MTTATTAPEGRIVYISEVPVNGMPPLFANEPDTFDMNHAASLLGVTRKTIQREINRGNLRCFHVGTRVRITKQALVDYVLEGEAV